MLFRALAERKGGPAATAGEPSDSYDSDVEFKLINLDLMDMLIFVQPHPDPYRMWVDGEDLVPMNNRLSKGQLEPKSLFVPGDKLREILGVLNIAGTVQVEEQVSFEDFEAICEVNYPTYNEHKMITIYPQLLTSCFIRLISSISLQVSSKASYAIDSR